MGRYSYIVNPNYRFYPDGSIVSWCYVVYTAAHRIEDFALKYVCVGGHNFSSWEGKVIGMEVIILHPQYDTSSMEFNTALVLLNETTKEDVAFVKLNENASYLVVGANEIGMGW